LGRSIGETSAFRYWGGMEMEDVETEGEVKHAPFSSLLGRKVIELLLIERAFLFWSAGLGFVFAKC
jgi:hypothetical protein